ncbi:MAG: hypothetical protein JNG90_05335 [Planctomycetaceae bacterium]|nr:hypothetical protein [Planctomycetaceae bacterium]
MSSPERLGGIIHTYQKFDPKNFPSPTAPPPDMVSGALEHMLAYGNLRELSPEELANAVQLDPSQIAGLGPSLEMLQAMLEERKRKILAEYETDRVQQTAAERYRRLGEQIDPPHKLREEFRRARDDEQIRELERLYYRAGDDRSKFARQLVQLSAALGDKYEIDELAGKYEFTGHTPLSIDKALEVKEELEEIDRLLKQLAEAAKTAQIGVIDLEELAKYAEPGDLEQLAKFREQIEQYLREAGARQGLDFKNGKFELTPKAMRLFQGRLLERIFSDLEASRSGRHQGPIVGEGAVEMQQTKSYEFGDSVTHMDLTQSLVNALLRAGPGLPVRMQPADIEIHRTRNNPKCATCVLMDMSGSMRYGGQYINVKRMALALDGLIRREYPGDFLQFLEIYSFAKPCHPSQVVELMPKMPTIFDPWVHLVADMSSPDISEYMVPPHFTNIQHGLVLARRFLAAQDTPNRQVILITDGLPTAHFEGQVLHLRYPPHRTTEEATLREAKLCQREGITVNIFLLSSWSQSSEDVQFAYRLAESTQGKVFFTGGRELDRYVVWDYLHRRRQIIS